jgi:DNA-binding transcriptional regulator YbjK
MQNTKLRRNKNVLRNRKMIDSADKMIFRYDNASNHPEVATYAHYPISVKKKKDKYN